MRQQFETIDAYIKSFPEDVQEILQKIRRTIRELAPKADEVISYGIPTFKMDGKYLVYFAAFKNHISMYPIPSGDEAFEKAIAPFVKGKGTLQFPLDQPIPYDLVKKIVHFHLQRREDLYK